MRASNATHGRPEIVGFSDYRDFLGERFSYEKSVRKAFSYQFCARRLGTSKAYLKLVIEKRRHISMQKVPLLWKLFGLDAFERQFFTILFLRTTAEDDALVAYFEDALHRLRSRLKHVGTHDGNPSSDDKDAVFKSWLSMAIHSLARFKGFRPDPRWLRQRLLGEASLEEIRATVDRLIADGAIRKEGDGWRPDEFVFRGPGEFDGDQYLLYRVGTRRAEEALRSVPQHRPSHYHMMSISLGEAEREKALQLYVEFRDRMIALSKETTDPTGVYFLSNNIFRVARETEA